MEKSLKIDEKLHKELKLYCVKNDFLIKEVIENLIKNLLKLENANQINTKRIS
jgi:hypothetical protein